jgi:hypothetical protein
MNAASGVLTSGTQNQQFVQEVQSQTQFIHLEEIRQGISGVLPKLDYLHQ